MESVESRIKHAVISCQILLKIFFLSASLPAVGVKKWFCNLWRCTGMSGMGMGDMASNSLLCAVANNPWQAFRAFTALYQSNDDLLILDLLHQNLRYHF